MIPRIIFFSGNGSTIDNPICMIEKTGEALPELDAWFYITVYVFLLELPMRKMQIRVGWTEAKRLSSHFRSLMGLIFSVCLIAGIVDYFFGEALKRHPISKSKIDKYQLKSRNKLPALTYRLFISCSMYTNIASIFEIETTSKVRCNSYTTRILELHVRNRYYRPLSRQIVRDKKWRARARKSRE